MRTFMLIAALVALPMQAQAALISGNDLVEGMREWEKYNARQELTRAEWHQVGTYQGYVTAAAEAYESMALTCLPTNVKVKQVTAIVAAYLKANPTKWHLAAIDLVFMSLVDGFPC